MSELLAIGISHKTAPVAMRERLALTEREAERFVRELVGREAVREAVAISTCNRTEVYLVVSDPVEAEAELLGMLAERGGIRPTELVDVVYSPRNCDAARHLFRVTSGLESMIVGESEVQGQVRRAYEAGAGGRHDRPVHEPPVPRRAADRQARAHRDRASARRASASSVGRRRPRARARSATSTSASC